MKLLLRYLAPYKWLVMLALLLAAINQSFSMLDPFFFGRLLDKYAMHPYEEGYFDANKKFIPTAVRTQSDFIWGVLEIPRHPDQCCDGFKDRESFPGLFQQCGGTEIRRENIYRWPPPFDETALPGI
jgi:ABC-type multidrug transport system fused ATPase/permease subunit